MDNLGMNRLVIPCAAGLEQLVAEEVMSWGGEVVSSTTGLVEINGSLEVGYRACLWSRFGSRVLLELASFKVKDESELYLVVKRIPWNEHIDSHGTFAVSCTLEQNASVKHSNFAALRVKDALVDQFREGEVIDLR